MGEKSLLGNARLQYQAGRLPQCGLMLWQLQTKGRRNVRSNMKKKCQEISGSTKTCEETEEAKMMLRLAEGRMVMLLTRKKGGKETSSGEKDEGKIRHFSSQSETHLDLNAVSEKQKSIIRFSSSVLFRVFM